MNYYNEHDSKAAAWLRELIRAGQIPLGDVDERSICDIEPNELNQYTQCHFFAGIGGWSYALQLAGWPIDRPVWTGSCPCQPFSTAGKQLGDKDERHLWPVFFRLITECRPVTVFGEQVASAIGKGWLDGVSADLEREGYACGATVLGAHSVGAPHIRQRLYWVAKREWERVVFGGDCDEDGNYPVCGIDFSECGCLGPTQDGVEYEERGGVLFGRVVNAFLAGLEGHTGNGDDGDESGRIDAHPVGSASPAGGVGHWSGFDLVHCLDGKARRIEPGTFPLAHGVPGRVGLLRGYGNAIVPQVAAEFIQAFEECRSAVLNLGMRPRHA